MLRLLIISFADLETKSLYETGTSRKYRNIESVAKRKLDMIHVAKNLQDLRVPPSNKLHPMTKEKSRKGQHAIYINDQFRICFTWKDDGAHGVEVTDYH